MSGQHLLLPGHGETGPTLETFSYDSVHAQSPPVAEPGTGHLTFEVEDVSTSLAAVLAHGSGLSEPARTGLPGTGNREIVYPRDPEGNLVDLQS